ncbi:hypothetical protein [Gordonia caeni]|uniref:Uncharacterized protein n=1 Tax=Gordonia caeni TaxID=1007097 RepID=A0ABP7PBG2_9ACTN
MKRHPTKHIGRVVTDEQAVYIMHPESCLRFHDDLRECRYSRALDNGIDVDEWRGHEDRPVVLSALAAVRIYPRFDQSTLDGGERDE